MLKLCRQYLNWIQNSVFEGELTESKLIELKHKITCIIHDETDSVIIFTNKMDYNMNKEILGKEKMSTDNFL
jgi:CRISPR-associated protein Cas2